MCNQQAWSSIPYLSMQPYAYQLTHFFFKKSGDHRGTPEALGRVVTVIERSFWETLSDLVCLHPFFFFVVALAVFPRTVTSIERSIVADKC